MAAALLVVQLSTVTCSVPDPDHEIQSIPAASADLEARLAPLARAIGDRRIVLLGENGHGVGEFTSSKVELVQWLHRELGFEVVVMESGFFECGHVWSRIAELSPRDALYQCLRYPFQHAELLPLFEYVKDESDSAHPLELAGMDPQAQGFDSEPRPGVLSARLARYDPVLASRIAVDDSLIFLPEASGGLGDAVYQWILENGAAVPGRYLAAADLTEGYDRWAFLLAAGLLDRLTTRARAEAAGETDRPPRYYELRDEWMARAVSALADSIAGPRRVAVWLHNDHARYGNTGSPGVRSTGDYLSEWYPDDTFTVGFFMGGGTVTDNARRSRAVEALPPGGIETFLKRAGSSRSYVLLTGNRNPDVRAWADTARAYLRMGIEPMTLVPAEAFDAVFYIDRVEPPSYDIP